METELTLIERTTTLLHPVPVPLLCSSLGRLLGAPLVLLPGLSLGPLLCPFLGPFAMAIPFGPLLGPSLVPFARVDPLLWALVVPFPWAIRMG